MVIVKKIFYFFVLIGLHNTSFGQHGFLQQVTLSDISRIQQLTDTGSQMRDMSFCLRPLRPFLAEKKKQNPYCKVYQCFIYPSKQFKIAIGRQ
jgi:hypothetical protein